MKLIALALVVVCLVYGADSVPDQGNSSFVVSFWEDKDFEGPTITFGGEALGKCMNLEDYSWDRRIRSVQPNTNCIKFFYSNHCTNRGISVDSKYPYKKDLGQNFFAYAAVSFLGSLGDCVPA